MARYINIKQNINKTGTIFIDHNTMHALFNLIKQNIQLSFEV